MTFFIFPGCNENVWIQSLVPNHQPQLVTSHNSVLHIPIRCFTFHPQWLDWNYIWQTQSTFPSWSRHAAIKIKCLTFNYKDLGREGGQYSFSTHRKDQNFETFLWRWFGLGFIFHFIFEALDLEKYLQLRCPNQNSKIDIYMGNKLSLGFWLGLAGLLREYPIKILFYPLAPFISQTGTTGSVPSNYPRDRQYYFMMTLLVLSPRAMSSQWLPILASLFPQIKPTKRPGREERRHQNQRISKRRYCYTQERERWDILPYS